MGLFSIRSGHCRTTVLFSCSTYRARTAGQAIRKKPGVLPGSYKCTRYRSESMSIAIQVWCNLRKIN